MSRFQTTASAIAILVLALAGCGPSKPKPSPRLAWAYPEGPDSIFSLSLKGPQQAPGSKIVLTAEQVGASPPDWFPDEHPPAPPVVAKSCGDCHMIEGQGSRTTDLAGLPAAYIVEQVREFRSGRRRSAQADRLDTLHMIEVAQKVSDADLAAAAAYYAALPRRTLIRAVETDTVPKTKPDRYGWLDTVPNGGREPIAGRIIEVPEDLQRLLISDPHLTLFDYVPVGSPARGAALVRSGGPGGQPCTGCHGADLKGGVAPPLAGRGAAYLARMLWDIRTGARNGPTVEQMQAPAGTLSEAQITDISAYLASLSP